MKCPNCGFEIPEGHMYCDSCGMEINFVPDFEPEVENEINATLSGMADELNKEERLRAEKREKRQKFLRSLASKWKLILAAVLTLVLVVVCIVLGFSYTNKTSLYYLSLAESSRSSGNIEEAIDYLKEGHEEHPTNPDIIFRMSDYYLEEGKIEEAVDALMIIAQSDTFPQDKIQSAYESIISIYKESGNYDELSGFLSNGNDEMIVNLRKKYIPNMPSMEPASGTYDVVNVTLQMLDGSGDDIFYTVNDGVPTRGSIKYEAPIVLDTEGTYNVKAVAINEYGVASVVAEGEYVLEKGAPDPPDIMEPSGEYNQNTMIVAVAAANCTIYYTTDRSEPTSKSIKYTSPITMPVGTSHYRFVACDEEGNYSEIVDRDYHLVYSRLVSAEQAVNSLVNTLVRLDYLLDASGKVRGVDGHNEYIYNSIIEIAGAGEYYMVIENHVSFDGVTTPTGLMYAVNTHDGTVNRLGYDSSGNYTLITISNR